MSRLMNGVSAGCILLTLAGVAEVQTAKVSLDDLLGDWLIKPYVELLQKTKSPLEAMKPIFLDKSRYTAFKFSKESNEYAWAIINNLHEGGFYMIDGLRPLGANTYAPVFSKGQYSGRETENDRIVYPDGSPDALEWVSIIDGKEQRIQFVRVKPTIELYVNHVVLAGEYTDAKGRRFVFTDDCKAEWPDKTFIYRIGIDHVLDKCDYLFIPTEKVGYMSAVYTFVWKGGNLIVYNVQFSEIHKIADPERDILYVLTPVKK